MNYLFGIQGRIGRLQWWGGQAIVWAIIIVAIIVFGASMAGRGSEGVRAYASHNRGSILLATLAIYVLCTWINVATTVKRYHDRDKSGAWFFVIFIPFIGGLWQLVECGFLAGSLDSNTYGPRGGGDAYGDFSGSGMDGARLNSVDAAIEAMRRDRTANGGRSQEQVGAVVRTRREPHPIGRTQPAAFGKRGRQV
jgi:uncharacterized membrane protein YhaH (DUF805 family)